MPDDGFQPKHTGELTKFDLRQNVRNSVEEIFDTGLLGCNAPAPAGTLRGIDTMNLKDVRQKLSRAGVIFHQAYGALPCFHNPQSYFEKIALCKFFAPIPMPSPADKLGVSRFIPEHVQDIVQPVPVLWQSHKAFSEAAIEAAHLPDGRYYLKTNNGCGTVMPLDIPSSSRRYTRLNGMSQTWLETEHGAKAGEWWYNLIGPKVFIEQDIGPKDKSIDDWKIHMGGGQILAVQVDLDRTAEHRQLIYDQNFTYLEEELFFETGAPIEKPAFFEDMRKAALAIGAQFEFARLDFYHADGQIYLGEVTLSPFGGQRAPRSAKLNQLMGQTWATGRAGGTGIFASA